jgi:hypothetical protein
MLLKEKDEEITLFADDAVSASVRLWQTGWETLFVLVGIKSGECVDVGVLMMMTRACNVDACCSVRVCGVGEGRGVGVAW